jgi:hypothetical protein
MCEILHPRFHKKRIWAYLIEQILVLQFTPRTAAVAVVAARQAAGEIAPITWDLVVAFVLVGIEGIVEHHNAVAGINIGEMERPVVVKNKAANIPAPLEVENLRYVVQLDQTKEHHKRELLGV